MNKVFHKLIIHLVILFALFAGSVYAMPIQTVFNKWAETNKIVGATLLINDKQYVYGLSNKSENIPVTKNTVFGIGSITKTFISVILLTLESEGKINIHDPITKYFPQYSKLQHVTIQSLMQMTAGLNDSNRSDDNSTPNQQINDAYQSYNPRSAGQWQYSNVSYQLLGLLIVQVTKKPLTHALSNYISNPLHLNSIYFPTTAQANSLNEYKDNHVSVTNFNNRYAAGGLVSNAQDLAILIRHLFITKDLLPTKQYKELTNFISTSTTYYAFTHTPPPLFGLGVFKWKIPMYGDVLTYPGVCYEGFLSTYVVVKQNIIIAQANTYNNNDFTLLWPHQGLLKDILRSHSGTSKIKSYP